MKRLDIFKTFLVAVAFCTLTHRIAAAPAKSANKPNIIYIMLDEWGYFEWSAMGHPILETPNIDNLAWKRVIK